MLFSLRGSIISWLHNILIRDLYRRKKNQDSQRLALASVRMQYLGLF